MLQRSIVLLLCGVLSTIACGGPAQTTHIPSVPPGSVQGSNARVKALADEFLAAFLERYPDQGTYNGIPAWHHDKLPDNSLAALTAWEAREDRWLTDAKAIAPASITDPPLQATYAILRETLEGAIGTRACRYELWNVSQMTGWQVGYGYLVTIQPVGTDVARTEALARWRALPKYLDTEIANLREGMRLKYSSPQQSVTIVLGQIESLIDASMKESPFMSPAIRDKDAAFIGAYEAMYKGEILPSLKRYRDFLKNEYLAAARTDIAIAANPNGLACYAAAVRAFSTLPVAARVVHDTGLDEIGTLIAKMRGIGAQQFLTMDLPALLQKVRTDKAFLFKSREELIAYSRAALTRAKAAAPRVFGLWPKADVQIEPYPVYREKNAPNEYNGPAEDGSRPGLFYINAYQAERTPRTPAEATAFHETIPGHHLQVAIALERQSIHPLGRYVGNSGYTEGWALYAEQLADELGLYSSELDRLGMLASQAFRAARLVVDSGIHTMGWSRQHAIDYMLAHTAESADQIASEVDRYIVYPGQATAYMLGMMEIRSAREAAREAMGDRFNLKAFHDRVLEDGAVPLGFLAGKIKSWAMMRP
jgi:uncharacterized protein (DUF885 family)